MNYIDAFIDLINTYNIRPEDVKHIQVEVAPVTMQVLRFHHPKDEMEARFSLTHSIACCFLDKKPWLESYTTERANDPQVKAFRDKVKMVVHPEWAVPESTLGVEMPILIQLKDGTEYRRVSLKPTDPIIVTDEEVMDKYMKCATSVLSKNRAVQVAETIMSLEKVKDISEFMTLLTFPDK
jgi:2-methylcitrate dehydratase PrpD